MPVGSDVLTSALGENPLAGSVFEEQNVHSGDTEWQEEHQHIIERKNSHGTVDVLDADDLPTFYSAIRMAPIAVLLALAGGMNGPISTEFLKIRVRMCADRPAD